MQQRILQLNFRFCPLPISPRGGPLHHFAIHLKISSLRYIAKIRQPCSQDVKAWCSTRECMGSGGQSIVGLARVRCGRVQLNKLVGRKYPVSPCPRRPHKQHFLSLTGVTMTLFSVLTKSEICPMAASVKYVLVSPRIWGRAEVQSAAI